MKDEADQKARIEGQVKASSIKRVRITPPASAAWPCNIMSRAARTLRCVVHTIATRATPISPIAATTAERDRRDRERGSGTEAITVAQPQQALRHRGGGR